MTSDPPRLSLAILVALTILGLSAFLRIRLLDWPPLSDSESVIALQAAEGTPEASAFWRPEEQEAAPASAAYTAFTRPLFVAFGANDRTARLVPALGGMALVALFLLRSGQPKAETLATGLLLAVSPALIAASRQASGLSIALLGLGSLFVPVCLNIRREAQAPIGWGIGLLAGFGLAAGGPALSGSLGFALGIGLYFAIARYGLEDAEESNLSSIPWQGVLGGMLAGLVLGGTSFGIHLAGLSSLGISIGVWVQAVLGGEGWPLAAGLLSLVAYEPLVFGLGTVAILRAWRQRDLPALALASWALGALLVHLFLPARGEDTLAWVVLPFAFLGGKLLIRIAERWLQPEGFWTTAGLTAALISLAAFIQVQLSTYARGFGVGAPSLDPGLSLAAAIAAIGLAIVALVLFGLGWSWGTAGNAAIGAAVVILFFSSFSAGWRLNYGREAASAVELWRPRASTSGIRLIQETLQAVSQAQTGRTDAVAVNPISPLPPALAWAIRAYPWVGAGGADLFATEPPVILASGAELVPQFQREYVGQTIVVAEVWGWAGGAPPDLIAWLVARQVPTLPEPWLILVDASLAGVESPDLDLTGP